MRDKIKKLLLNFTSWQEYLNLTQTYIDYLLPERVTYKAGMPSSKNSIIVFVIRCNERIDFNDEERNNDLLVIVEYVSENNYNVFTFNVTADPKGKKPNIAHLIEQVYTGNIGLHRSILGRICIRSDKGTWFKRTDANGVVDEAQFGAIGINLHDTGGFFNSSLGCVILESDNDYKNIYKPLLKRVSNDRAIPVSVINMDFWDSEQAKAINGVNVLVTEKPDNDFPT